GPSALQLLPPLARAVDFLVLPPHAADVFAQTLVATCTRGSVLGITLPCLVLVVQRRAIGSTPQIGSIPNFSRWSSMKVTITSLGGRAPPSRNTPTPAAGSRSPLQLAVLALQILQPRLLVGRQSGPPPLVTLGW